MRRYLVLALRTPRFDPAQIGPHDAHLARLRAYGRLELAGPFPDRSGGAYVVLANDLDEAQAFAFADPLHASGSAEVSVREWRAGA